jgi:hypothetical protein
METKINNFIIGSDELANKTTGLARYRIYSIINCSANTENSNDKFIRYIRIKTSPMISGDLNKQTFDFNHNVITEDIIQSIIDVFHNSSDKKKIMLQSENDTKSRLLYCLIAMKVLKITLKQLVQIFEERSLLQNSNNSVILSDANYDKLSSNEIQYLIQLETDIYGKTTYEMKNDITLTKTTEETPVITNAVPMTTNAATETKTITNTEEIPKTKSKSNDDYVWKYANDYDMNDYNFENENENKNESSPPPPAQIMQLLGDYNDPYMNMNMNYHHKNKPPVHSTELDTHKATTSGPLRRTDDFIQIMAVMNGRADAKLIKDKLNKGESVSSIINELTK